jgi:hypothetical protein
VKKRDARSMTRLVAALAAVSVAVLVPRAVSAVTVFRCDESGRITYQSEPCKSPGKRIELPTVPVSPSASTKAADDAKRLRAAVAAQAAARRAAEVSAEVANLNAEIEANETKRQSELAVLQARLDHVAVNMAGAPWERTAARNDCKHKCKRLRIATSRRIGRCVIGSRNCRVPRRRTHQPRRAAAAILRSRNVPNGVTYPQCDSSNR